MTNPNSRRRVVASEWVSLDGVFDADSMDQWFDPYDSPERATYIQETIQSCGAFLHGRVTYEMLAPYWSGLKNNEMGIAEKINSAPKYIVSSSPLKFPWNHLFPLHGAVAEEVGKLKQEPGQDILMMGSGTLVHSLLSAGLIDELKLLVHPIIVGRGKRFFTHQTDMSKLELIKTQTLSLGVVLLCYQPAKRQARDLP